MPTPMPYTDILDGVVTFVGDLGLWSFIIAGFIASAALFIFRRFSRGKF